MVMITKQEYNNMTGYATNQYCSVRLNLASIKRVAESVHQAIQAPPNIKPRIPRRRSTVASAARKMTGNKQ